MEDKPMTATQVKQSIEEWEKRKAKEVDKVISSWLASFKEKLKQLLKDKEEV